MQRRIFYAVMIFLILSNIETVVAEGNTILITASSAMDKVIFDGKWSHTTEWKQSSYNMFSYNDDNIIHLRTAHQDDFIYIFVGAVSVTHFDKEKDSAMICFDSNNDKSSLPDSNDYCFMTTLDGMISFIYQGNSSLALENFKKLTNSENFIGIGGVSDQNDRYSNIPHASYEFKIPTKVIGRSNAYGFYLAVYDANSKSVYSWPQTTLMDSLQVPSPRIWGNLVSPDNSLPEFNWPILALLPSILFVIYLTRFRIKK